MKIIDPIDPASIAVVIKELRKRRNLTQIQLAYKAGVSPPMLTRIEKYKKPVMFKVIEKLLTALLLDK